MTKDWDPVKSEIRRLYQDQNKTLAEVMRLMKGNYGFIASERSYRKQLRDWGYMKNNTENFQSNRAIKKRRKTRTAVTTHFRDMASPQVTMATQFDSFHLLPASTPSQSYLHGGEPWQFEAPSGSSTGAASSQYPAFGHTPNGINHQPSSTSMSSLNAQDADGKTQLHRAVINGSEEQVKHLLATGAAVDIEDNAQNQPLNYAVLGGSVAIVQLLLRFGSDCDCKGQNGRYPLHNAIPSVEILEVLLKSRADTSSRDEKGDTPLHLALSLPPSPSSTMELEKVVQLLLDAGADVNAANGAGVTPFHIVINLQYQSKRQRYDYLEPFLQCGADISLRTRDNKLPFEIFLEWTEYDWPKKSIYYNDSLGNTSFRLFISKGADPNTRLRSGELVIHHHLQYSKWGKDETLTDFLCERVNPCIVSGNGNFLLHELCAHAKKRGKGLMTFAELLRISIDRGADLNQLSRSGLSPLMVLVNTKTNLKGILDWVDELLKGGANPMLRDRAGNLPLYKALRKFQSAADDLGKKLIHASINLGDDALESSNNRNCSVEESGWWQKLGVAAIAVDWDGAKDWLCGPQSALPSDVSRHVCSIALVVLAEQYLEKAKEEFEPGYASLDDHRRYVGRLIRDCRNLDLAIDMKWLYYLSELC